MVTTSPPVEAQADHEVTVLAANVAVSGLTAGVVSMTRGESFWDGLLGGMGGGAVTYVGKQVATWNGSQLGFLGREIAAVGTSLTRSAAFGTGLLDTLMLPVGPLRLYVTPSRLSSSSVRVDAEELMWIAYAAASDKYRFHAGRSLQTGAFVFSRSSAMFLRNGERVRGQAASGIIWLHDSLIDETLPHELVHVIQIDQVKALGGLPLERRIRRWISGGDAREEARPWRWLDVGLGQYPFRLLLWNPMELEADAFGI